MCGRFTLVVGPDRLLASFPGFVFPDEIPARYNIAPGQDVALVTNDGRGEVQYFRWGLVPSWARDPKIGNRMINARAETLAEKPSFRTGIRKRRCLILADGFYEWRRDPGASTKTPIYIRLVSGEPFAFAGLWDSWRTPEGDPLRTCTIVTTAPNELLREIHNRMPVILQHDAYGRWLDPTPLRPEDTGGLLVPYPARGMAAHAVSRTVNNPTNDSAECIQPVEDEGGREAG